PSRAPRALHRMELRREGDGGRARDGARHAATPSASQPVDARAGLRTRGRGTTCPRSPRLPMRMHSGGCGGRTRLPLRGQCRNGCVACCDDGVTGFPFQPLDEDPRATLELAALYGMDEPGSESTFHPNPPAATYHPESRL